MSVASSGQGDGNESQVEHAAEGMSLQESSPPDGDEGRRKADDFARQA